MRYFLCFLGLVALGLMMAGGCGDDNPVSSNVVVAKTLTPTQQGILAWMAENVNDPDYEIVRWALDDEPTYKDGKVYERTWLKYRQQMLGSPVLCITCFDTRDSVVYRKWDSPGCPAMPD